ncbi:cysteine/serine-rich nuclear protein 1-like [Denticeps clupeoides]|uniref:Cysteine/serine-rich nuclear protein N-terminal domain-containing protein n=1 Tax=Denticeps clupeoides TaxID=299321 RepID=A0AAY4A397_9TELE|nr:cysteine/serine-rich nuclear protein 1-like [Denticeps clupeoides]XP_028834466.1 cysteine/serine-rich nuclear protein 1-like [Denticeps clupeoides]XP_028834467.1 cysteine/serine-rich nuclear protein 1-like [Denticeps clupeoides]
MSRDLKRKFEDSDEDPCYSSSPVSSESSPGPSGCDSDGQVAQCDSPGWGPASPPPPSMCRVTSISSILKRTKGPRAKARVHFDTVTVFFFRRCQGFTSVPSHGGCTLGMEKQHAYWHRCSLAEHSAQQHHVRRERLGEERLEALKERLVNSSALPMEEVERLTVGDLPEEELNTQARSSLHSYSSKKRRALLWQAGVVHIDRQEKRELQELRRWREECGCRCQGYCEPETCDCSLAGIKCQMDRSNFPCGCTKDSCGNPMGRVEFNAGRVRTHYIHTLMRLELDRRLLEERLDGQQGTDEEEDEDPSPVGSPVQESGADPCYRPRSPNPSFLFSPELSAEGENSCSSDMTDSSYSSGQSQDSRQGLTCILSLCGSDEDLHASSDSDGISLPHKRLKVARSFIAQSDNRGSRRSLNVPDSLPLDSCSFSISGILDENANQSIASCDSDFLPDIPNTPSPSVDYTYSYTDPSSDSNLDFFDSFDDFYSNSHFKGYNQLNNFPLSLTVDFCRPEVDESGIELLESLIELS